MNEHQFLCTHAEYYCGSFNLQLVVWFGFMVFNATFNNIAVIWWRSVLLVKESGVPGENHRPVTSQ
jgi:hypothetical protein